jgi:serine/threonine-protein phosphatase CPPED1
MGCHVFMVYLLLAISTITFAQNSSDSIWFFIQLTDPQLGMFENNESFEKETILFEKAVVEINRLAPDFIVITGDMVHNQNSQEQIDEFKRLVSKINKEIPVYLTPGNHDVGKIPDKQSLKKYKKNYGRDRFSFEHKGVRFIGFNTSLIKGKIVKEENKQFKWLQKQINNGENENQIILFCHYPFFDESVDEPDTYHNIEMEYRKKYLDLFEKNAVSAVFSGHRHTNILNNYGSVELVTTSALGKPLGKYPSGFRIVKISGNKIEHKFYGLDEAASINW